MIATRRLYLLLALAAVPFALYGLMPALRTAGIAADVIIAVLVFVDYQLTPRPGFISATRVVQDRLSIGRENPVTLHVTSQAPVKLAMLLKDDYPRELDSNTEEFEFEVAPGAVTTLEYSLRPGRRGAYSFGNITVRYRSFLGLFRRQLVIPQEEKIKVYSDLKRLHELSIKLAQSTELGELHQRKRGQGTDFASLREYTVGDDTKAIDWKATARRDRPVVRTFEAEQEQRLFILLDAGRMMLSDLEGLRRFDHALNAALCLALTGLSHNDQVGLGIFCDRPLLNLPPRRGKQYMRNILESTFAIEPQMIEPDYLGMLSYFATVQKGRSLIVVLTDLTDPTGSQSLLAGLASLSGKHLPFCVTLKDRQISKVSQFRADEHKEEKTGEVVESIYRRAVATDLLAQRDLALSVLQRKGCLVLDCPPQELSDQLVDAYLEIKTRARL